MVASMTSRSRWTRQPRAVRSWSAVLLAVLLVPLVACSDDTVRDELQVVENPTSAVAVTSPEPLDTPAGIRVPQSQDIQDLVVEPMNRVLVAALTEPPAILLYDLDQPNAEPERIDLPAAAEELTTAQGTVLAPLPNAEMLAKITLPEGDLTTIPVSGG